MTLRTRTDALLIFGFCAFLFFYGAGQFGLIGADEPRYAQVAREMLDRRDWITPVLDGRPWLEKPPLYYWQAMLAYSVLGVRDVAARLPSAIDATLLVIAVYLFFRRFRRGVEVDAALITASGAGVIGYARAASMDMALAASFAIGMLAWWAWRESGRRIYLAAFYLCMALGMLAKGPVAPVLAAVIIVLFAMAVREWRLMVRTLWLPGIVLFCAIALPWYVAVEMRNPQFFREFILEHNLARFSSDLYHHRQPFWYYLPVAALALVPWIVFVVAAFADSMRVWWAEKPGRARLPVVPQSLPNDRGLQPLGASLDAPTEAASVSAEPDFELQFNLFACLWLVVPVVFFSISQSKLPGYILPAIPAGAVLLADYLRRHLEREEPVPKWMAVLHALVAAAPIVPALLIGYAVTEHRLPGGRPMLIALAIAFVLCAAIALTLVSRLQLRMLRFVTLIPVVLAVAAVLKLGTTPIDQTLSARPLAAELAGAETHELPVAVCGVSRELEYGLEFYRNQTITRCEFAPLPAGEHLVVAPSMFRYNIAEKAPGRRVMFLGHYAPQGVDYYWVAAASAKR
ncbi:MAG: glycosyltransferase family 39 protein [Candidatus Sulfotelmatobacter sp.]|jgi:4-amino-4-deoxy-L-arabinose transferase-like glycosyltransferase